MLSGRYRIIKKIGTGGMGVVYKVEDEKLDGRLFALKALPPDMSQSSAAIKRLKKEAHAAIELHHPNIMALHSFDDDGQHHYLVMELLDGSDLEDALVDKERFSVDEVLDVARQVCPALDYAHERGIIHRDIKPGNLLYKKEGEKQIVKVADFGIAYQVRNSIARITGQDTTGGTMHYMPPEQLAGRDVDARADIYSLAATLYELLRGRPPFEGAGGMLMRQIEEKSPVEIPDVPEHVNAALLKGLAKKPEDRFASCAEMLRALEGKIAVAPPVGKQKGQETKSSSSASIGIVVLLLVALFGLGHSIGLFSSNPPVEPTAESAAKASPTVVPIPSNVVAATKVVKPTKEAVVPTRYGKLYLTSEPTDAAIFIDGKDTGKKTNTILQAVSFGEHEVWLEKSRYKTAMTLIQIEDEGLLKPKPLKLVPDWGSLIVKGSPSNASLKLLPIERTTVSEKEFTFGQTLPNLSSGRYLVEARAPLHQMASCEISVPADGLTTSLNIRLERLRANLTLSSNPPAASISIDGVLRKEKTPAQLELECGTHQVELEKGNDYWNGSIALGERGATKELTLRLTAKPKGPKPGEERTVAGIKFCWCPPGGFWMGSPSDEAERESCEGPRHKVRITKGFWLGKYEVSQSEWQQVMGGNPSNFKGSRLPVENVSWDDCQKFLSKINGQNRGKNFRLPTEAEWEYACRAGTTTPFYFGRAITPSQVNYNGNYPYGGAAKGLYREKTTDVGTFPSNDWGLHDMHGNVCEWCHDWYSSDYYGKSPAQDPRGPSTGPVRVIRGGSWNNNAKNCRAAIRNNNLGFRLL